MTHVPWHPDDIQSGPEIHGLESVELHSVGIDIGTTTTHLMISRLLARREGGEFSSKFRIDERERVYESEIFLTPFVDEETIDTDALEDIVDSAYGASEFTTDDIDTGAVIITGEASRKENAEAIADLFSQRAGDFVCATAGADLEALMSAHGSGAVDHAIDTDQNLLHVDIGGGTTKVAYVVDGFVEETASINVGARLVEFAGPDGTVSRIEDAARFVADRRDIELAIGNTLTDEEKDALADEFSNILFEFIDEEITPAVERLLVTEIPEQYPFDAVTFSGGGAEYVYTDSAAYYDDLGPQLGRSIRQQVDQREYQVDTLDAGIRATAIGSTEHNVQISGNTITLTDEEILPLRNIPMVPFVVNHHDDVETVIADMREKLELYDIDVLEEPFAFGLHLHGQPKFEFLKTVVDASITSWEEMHEGKYPLILAFETDVAMNAGRLAEERVDSSVISVDGVELDQFGYIDIGEPVEETNAVPLTVKSLLFEG